MDALHFFLIFMTIAGCAVTWHGSKLFFERDALRAEVLRLKANRGSVDRDAVPPGRAPTFAATRPREAPRAQTGGVVTPGTVPVTSPTVVPTAGGDPQPAAHTCGRCTRVFRASRDLEQHSRDKHAGSLQPNVVPRETPRGNPPPGSGRPTGITSDHGSSQVNFCPTITFAPASQPSRRGRGGGDKKNGKKKNEQAADRVVPGPPRNGERNTHGPRTDATPAGPGANGGAPPRRASNSRRMDRARTMPWPVEDEDDGLDEDSDARPSPKADDVGPTAIPASMLPGLDAVAASLGHEARSVSGRRASASRRASATSAPSATSNRLLSLPGGRLARVSMSSSVRQSWDAAIRTAVTANPEGFAAYAPPPSDRSGAAASRGLRPAPRQCERS